MEDSGLDRREFLTRSMAVAVGLVGAGFLASCTRPAAGIATSASPQAVAPPAATATEAVLTQTQSGSGQSKVALIRSTNLMETDTKPSREKVLEIIDRGVKHVFGTDSAEAAWQQVASANDVVALKVNCICGHLSSNPVVTYAICQRLMEVGVPPQNLIIFDRSTGELQGAGYEIVKSGTAKPHCHGTDGDYSEAISHRSFKHRLSKILTDRASVLINVPVLKTHDGGAQVTLAMKNHYGTIDQPGPYHGNNCDPFIADINDIPAIKNKTRLIVLDASRGCWAGGPGPKPATMWTYMGIAVSNDPVACDFVGNRLINQKRAEQGQGPISGAAGGIAKHILTAAQIGLGKADEQQIDFLYQEIA